MSKANLRAKIFAAQDLKVETVEVPEWDTTLELHGLGIDDYRKVADSSKDGGKLDFDKYGLHILIACARDPDSKERVFTPADRDELAKKSGAVVGRLAAICMKLCGMGDEEEKKIEGESAPTPSGKSSSE